MPFPDVGQVKIPGQDEIDMREKLEAARRPCPTRRSASTSTTGRRSRKMNLADEGAMLTRIQMFKDHRAKVAQDRARALGLTHAEARPDGAL